MNERLLLLGKLIAELNSAVSMDATVSDYQSRYNNISAAFDNISAFKNKNKETLPGVNLNNYKRNIRDYKNTYHSVYTGIVDEEIGVGKARKDLSSVLTKLQALYAAMEEAEEQQQSITMEMDKNAATLTYVEPETPKLVIEKEKPKAVTGATFGDAIADQAKNSLNKMAQSAKAQQELQNMQKDAKQIGDAVKTSEKQLANIVAPASPADYRHVQEHNPRLKENAEQKQADVKQHDQDESQYNALSQYQPALRKLASVHATGDSQWAIGKGPIFFSSKPYVSPLDLKKAKIKATQFYPGWILADQFLFGVKKSLLAPNKKAELMQVIKHAQQALAIRMDSKLVFMVVKSDAKTFLAPEKILKTLAPEWDRLKLPEGVTRNDLIKPSKELLQELQKQSQALSKRTEKDWTSLEQKDKLAFETPEFRAVAGSDLAWTWVLPNSQKKQMAPFKVLIFGFPEAQLMRSLDERVATKIVPNRYEDREQLTEDVSKLRVLKQERDAQHELESKPLQEELAKLATDVEKVSQQIASLIEDNKALMLELATYQQALMHAGKNIAARANAEKLLHDTEDKLATINGSLAGLKMVLKVYNTKKSSLIEQKTALLHSINLKFRKQLEGKE